MPTRREVERTVRERCRLRDVGIAAGWVAAPRVRWVDATARGGGRARSTVTRRRLLLAACRMIDERGYRGSGLSDILAVSGFSKGALYFHFDSKEELADALVAEVFASWDDAIGRIVALGPDPLQTLLMCYDVYAARLTYDVSARAALRVVQDGVGRHYSDTWARRWEKDSERLLVSAGSEGLLRPSIDPVWLSQHLLAVAQGHFVLSSGKPAGPSLWDRMNSTWIGLLPAVTCPQWQSDWRSSGWEDREEPRAEHFDFDVVAHGADAREVSR